VRAAFVAGPSDHGRRLDQVLADRIEGMSRRKARVLLDLGGVFVDGARVKVASRTVRKGQRIVANVGSALDRATKAVGEEARRADEAKLPPHRLVHIDEHVVIVFKPAGLLTAPTPEGDRNNLAALLSARDDIGPVRVVHRLDLPTSGLLVFARTELASRFLSERFQVHDVERSYLAIVAGRPATDEATLTSPIAGKRAVTHVSLLEAFGATAALLRCRLETGRTHQIRIHAAGAGHPILGDRKYGAPPTPTPPRLALHATTLGFTHPATGETLRFEEPLPDDLSSFVVSLRAATTV
jgi:23S rRNA pseudouridine1911/1915/1917 synthase